MTPKRAHHVAFFLPSLRGGGAERTMVNLAGAFAEAGLAVDLVLAKAEGPYLAQLPPSVRLVDLKARRVASSFPRLVRYLRKERPWALVSAMDHANLVAIWARDVARVPVRLVVSVRTTLSKSVAHDRNRRARWIPLGIRFFYPRAEAVVAISEGVAEDLVRFTGLPREKIRVIYNPVVTPELLAKAEEPLDHPWFAPGEPPVILAAGRLTKQKDFPTLVRAYALLRKGRPARLMILGEGEERPRLEALVRELGLTSDVALPGFVENPYKYMRRASVFVLSSRWEGLGNVLIEAMACGTPVVSTDCPSGPSEILEGGRFGRLVPVGREDLLARAIEETLDAPVRVPSEALAKFHLDYAASAYLVACGLRDDKSVPA